MSKSYNESIRNQGHAAIEQEIYGEYSSIPTDDDNFALGNRSSHERA